METEEGHDWEATLLVDRSIPESPRNFKKNPLDSCASQDFDARAFRNVSRIRRLGENGGEFRSVEGGNVALEASFGSCAHEPGSMKDAILDRAAGPLAGVAPIMFGDVLLQAALRWKLRRD